MPFERALDVWIALTRARVEYTCPSLKRKGFLRFFRWKNRSFPRLFAIDANRNVVLNYLDFWQAFINQSCSRFSIRNGRPAILTFL